MEWDWSRIDDPRFVATEPGASSGANNGGDGGGGGGGAAAENPDDEVQILNEQPMMDVDRNIDRPDTAAAVGRPDTAAAVRPGTSGTLGGTGGRR